MAFGFGKFARALGLGGGTNQTGAVGVDVGSSSIKVVQLKRNGETASLETYGELQLGPYADLEIGRATNLDTPRLSEALVDIIREASVSSKNAGFAIPYASSFVTIIELPTTSDEKLASMVPIEARKYVPVPINDVTLDWFVIPPPKGATQKDGVVNILLAAIHNETIYKYQNLIKNSALLSQFTEIEIFSTVRGSAGTDVYTSLIVDIGAATTKMYIVAGGVVQRTHSVNLAGQDMTIALSKSLELSMEEAEEMKRQLGMQKDQDARLREAMLFTIERIVTEAQRMLMRFEGETGLVVEQVTLAGGGSALIGLDAFIANTLQKDVVRANPFGKVEYPAFLEDTLTEAGPSFTNAIGVALRRLNEG